MTRYIDVNDIRQLLRTIGPETFIHTLADYIRADYLRWPEFDKSPAQRRIRPRVSLN